MPILTIDLPEEAYQNAISLPAEERERVVIDAFATARDAFAAARNIPASERLTKKDLKDIREGIAEMPADHMTAIAKGIADADAGRVRPLSEFFAALRSQHRVTTVQQSTEQSNGESNQ